MSTTYKELETDQTGSDTKLEVYDPLLPHGRVVGITLESKEQGKFLKFFFTEESLNEFILGLQIAAKSREVNWDVE